MVCYMCYMVVYDGAHHMMMRMVMRFGESFYFHDDKSAADDGDEVLANVKVSSSIRTLGNPPTRLISTEIG